MELVTATPLAEMSQDTGSSLHRKNTFAIHLSDAVKTANSVPSPPHRDDHQRTAHRIELSWDFGAYTLTSGKK
jgi:hypothetical protein